MIRLLVSVLLAVSIALSYSAYAATEEFYPLGSSMEFGLKDGKATLKILSEISFGGRVVNDSTWEKMTDEEKNGGYVNIYYYKYTFTNSGTIKLRFTFANYDALRSPLFQFVQDLSIVLEPGQTKTIHFSANTAPKAIDAGCIVMAWFPEKGKWFSLWGGGSGLGSGVRKPSITT